MDERGGLIINTNINYRTLNFHEADLIRQIDRSEYVDAVYYHREGKLVLEPEVWDVLGFYPPELEKIVAETHELLQRGGTVYGAFIDARLVGISSVECDFIGSSKDTLQMPLLHVSAHCRGIGVGQTLMKLVIDRARDLGAKKLYVSATPSRHTVHFYQRMGCTLATEVDPVLFAKEPEDIHLELAL